MGVVDMKRGIKQIHYPIAEVKQLDFLINMCCDKQIRWLFLLVGFPKGRII